MRNGWVWAGILAVVFLLGCYLLSADINHLINWWMSGNKAKPRF